MTYLKVVWHHDFEKEAILVLSELDDQRYETRKIEFFRDGGVGFADGTREFRGTGLSEVPIPGPEEDLDDPQFEVSCIEAAEFERAWLALAEV